MPFKRSTPWLNHSNLNKEQVLKSVTEKAVQVCSIEIKGITMQQLDILKINLDAKVPAHTSKLLQMMQAPFDNVQNIGGTLIIDFVLAFGHHNPMNNIYKDDEVSVTLGTDVKVLSSLPNIEFRINYLVEY